MATTLRALLTAALAALLAACASVPPAVPADAFFANLRAHCGNAYAGRVLVDTPPASGSNPFAGKPLRMHVRECSDDTIRIPFQVGDDRSRTWVITRTASGLRLKHEHRHADGNEDAVSRYGGDSLAPGTAQRQAFPVDAESIATFAGAGLSASLANTWAIELAPGRSFVYELSRPDGRLFRVEFDLATPVPAPPAPWGAD